MLVTNEKELLIFGEGNSKLDKKIATFSLPSGYACPGAKDCLSRADRNTGKITDGKDIKFRCFSAMQEAMFPSVRKNRWSNFELLKDRDMDQMVDLIYRSLPKNDVIRIHVAGDFFNLSYFDAWLMVAGLTPNKLFYAYTKCLDYWVKRLERIPNNLKLTASKGGKHDWLINEHNLKYAEVVFSEQEAKNKGLEIDHSDALAYGQDKSFALLLHGSQPANTIASKALSSLRIDGFTGYNKNYKIKKTQQNLVGLI